MLGQTPRLTRGCPRSPALSGRTGTMVIVTHNMQQAQRVSEYCAFLLAAESNPGGIVESGLMEKLFEDPHDPRTANYAHGRFG
jgi:phosphate transport system ATP-binding protein